MTAANIETPSTGIPVNVSCPCSIWGTHVTPSLVDSGDGNAVELGVKFTSDTNASDHWAFASTRRRRTPAPTSVACGRPPARCWPRRRSRTRRPPAGRQVNFSSSGQHHRRARRTSPRTSPRTATTPRRQGYFYPPPSPPGLGGGTVDSGPFHALREHRLDDERRLHLRRIEHASRRATPTRRTTGSIPCTAQ